MDEVLVLDHFLWQLCHGFNVAGLARREAQVRELPPGIWNLTETQLAAPGIRSFAGALKANAKQDQRSLRFVHGAAAPPRTLGSSAGTWTGVAVMADFPLQENQVIWRGAEYVSARTLVTTSWAHGIAITGAVVYGAAQSPTWKEPKRLTSQLLETCTEEIFLGRKGPRYICGDFNANRMDLAPTHEWYQAGWRELQQAAQEWWHRPTQPTCKMVTERDFMWCSPELLQMLQDVQVLHHRMPDHSAVLGVFKVPTSSPTRTFWPMPHCIPWEQVQHQQWSASVDAQPFEWKGDMTKAFRSWSQQVETSLNGHLSTSDNRLPPHCGGRGLHVKPKTGKVSAPLMTSARPGEEALRSDLVSPIVHLWYKQLRRMQALLFSLRSGKLVAGAWTFQAQCWRSIVSAKGFKHSFASWWLGRSIRLQNAPSCLPDGLPSLHVMESIFADYRLNFRSFEEWHLSQRKKLLRVKREGSMKALFQTMRPEPHEPLDFLKQEETSSIVEVEPGTDLATIDPPMTSLVGSWTLNGLPITVAVPEDYEDVAAHCKLHLYTDRLIIPGQTLTRSRTLTASEDIQQELQKLWEPRWKMVENIPSELWDRILAFSSQKLPKLKIELPDWQPTDLERTLRRGRGLRTRGPDGWSREDVLNLAPHFQRDLTGLFGAVERGAPWPDQTMVGHATCLAKTADAEFAAQYRPVTLYSLIYRLWSCFRSRQLLAALTKGAVFDAFGYMAGRSCMELTYAVQAQVELAVLSGTSYCGVLIDIVRCFNHLPRRPIMYAARMLGLSHKVLQPWSSFLRQNRRAFRVRQEVGEFLSSDSGLPEGDSMSCVGMVVILYTLHTYMECYSTCSRAMSYVDNIQITADSPAHLVQGHLTASAWADLLGLTFDAKKTLHWATQAQDRKLLQTYGYTIVEGAKDLGSAMCFGARHRNGPLQKRIQDVKPFWTKLRFLQMSLWHKHLLVKMALLPRSLYGGALAVLGQHWIVKLRAWAMKGLRYNRAGASPLIRLCCIAPIDVDPGFFDCWQTWREFLRQMNLSVELQRIWAAYIEANSSKRTYGPFSKILEFCKRFGWSLDVNLQLYVTENFVISLLQTDQTSLRFLMENAWRRLISHDVCLRKDYQGLEGIAHEASFFKNVAHGRADSELLSCIQDGTFFLDSVKAKMYTTQDENCAHCGLPDSLEHRAMTCPKSTHIREEFHDCVQLWHAFPIALTHHGIASELTGQMDRWAALHALYDKPCEWQATPSGSGIQDIFTDGSCFDPENRAISLAAWSCVLASKEKVLGSGLLPGFLQCIPRAELWAVIQAFRWCREHHCVARIFSDAAFVVNGVAELRRVRHVPPNWHHQDLWQELWQLICTTSPDMQVLKVKAHQDLAKLDDQRSQWLAYWNTVADTSAKIACQTAGSGSFRALHASLLSEFAWKKHWATRYQTFLLRLAHCYMDVASPETEPSEEAVAEIFHLASPNIGDWQDSMPLDYRAAFCDDPRIQQFGTDHAIALTDWILILESKADFLRPVTFLELYFAFVGESGAVLPVSVGSADRQRWLDVREIRAGEILNRTLGSQLAVFESLFGMVVSCLNVEVEFSQQSIPHCNVQLALNAVMVPWPCDLAEKTRCLVSGFCRNRPIRRKADLARHWP